MEGPTVRANGIWLRFRVAGARDGLPDLAIEGEHLVRVDNGRIVAIEESVLGDGGRRASAYLERHGAALRPPGDESPQALLSRRTDLQAAFGRTLVRFYGAAKNAGDLEAALVPCHPDFVCDLIPFGLGTNGREDTAKRFAKPFGVFGDFHVDVETLIAEGDFASCWGRQRLTMLGELGFQATGKTSEQAFACHFVRDCLLARETCFFDLAEMCDQMGIDVARTREALGRF